MQKPWQLHSIRVGLANYALAKIYCELNGRRMAEPKARAHRHTEGR
jgi:hypothetical protein